MRKAIYGLSEDEVIASRARYGSNSLEKIKSRGLVGRFFENLSDPIIKILLIALALEVIFTFGNCNLVEVFGIVAAILIATVVSTVSEYGSERAFSKLEESERQKCRVMRGGSISLLQIDEIVVGDIVLIESGETVPADGRLIDGEVGVDQSALNGENVEVRKRVGTSSAFELSNDSKVFRGSSVVTGSAVMEVERVGGASFFGMVAKDVQVRTRVSPLKLRLSKLAASISKLGYVVALMVGLTYLFNCFVSDNGFVWSRIVASFKDTGFVFSTLLHTLTLMITVVVVAVPEGLPMMITVVLSANMRRMLRDNILVKKMVGIETAGSLNILFTDKTGTLTQGKMSVDRIILPGKCLTLEALSGASPTELDSLIASAYLNTDSKLENKEAVGGNFTDRAILDAFKIFKAPKTRIISKTPFSSERKISKVELSDGRILIKGAPELLLASSKYIHSGEGRVVSDLSFAKKEYLKATDNGERVIAVVEGNARGEGYTFIALIVLKDRLRRGVKKAVSEVSKAGIQTVMLTGDNLSTAVAIAQECGIYSEGCGQVALSSDELSRMNDGEVVEILPRLRVLARALPRDKTRLVALAQGMGKVTGMTGDGVNDAPSLKLSDVGFSMGSGTEIAKSAGDIVILDNSFNSIAKTVLYGRTIFKSIRKFITFQLIMNLAACGITLIGQFFGIDNPITIIQMLWVNIIMDTLGGLAFAGEAPLSYYMKDKPKKREEPILSRSAVGHIICNGTYTLLLLLLFLNLDYFRGFYGGSRDKLMCAFYALFIFCGLFNCLTARSERIFILSNIGKNKAFILIMMLICGIQMLIIYFGGALFRSAPLAPRELVITVALAFSVVIFDFCRRIAFKLK